jgi:hypothetical protein
MSDSSKLVSSLVRGSRICLCLGLVLFPSYQGAALPQDDSIPGVDAAPGFRLEQQPEDESGGGDDSLRLSLLKLEAERFRRQSDHTSFWHRLIPAVHFSAGFGWRDLILLDPATLATSILPKDSYRITIGLSLDGIFDDSQHAEAELMLQKIEAESGRVLLRRRRSKMKLADRLEKLRLETESIREAKGIIEEELRFNELRFRQGKVEFDALLKSRLRLAELNSRLQLLELEAGNLRRLNSRDGAQ